MIAACFREIIVKSFGKCIWHEGCRPMEITGSENSWISPVRGPWIWTSWTAMSGARPMLSIYLPDPNLATCAVGRNMTWMIFDEPSWFILRKILSEWSWKLQIVWGSLRPSYLQFSAANLESSKWIKQWGEDYSSHRRYCWVTAQVEILHGKRSFAPAGGSKKIYQTFTYSFFRY